MSRAPSPVERMIDASVRCVKCDAPYGGCNCWQKCRCGWTFERGGECRNPVHQAEQDADEAAQIVAGSVVSQMAECYPEPMRHASGGFRKTLREIVRREVAKAILKATGNAPSEDAERASLAELEAAIDMFRRSPRGAA